MPVIPFSSASRITEIDRETQEQRDAEEARRYRELADAKLKELMNTPVKRFDPQGGTSPIDVPEPVTGGWRVRTNGDPQPNGDALPGGAFNRMGAPDIDDPMRDEQGFGGPDNWTPELAMPASPEGESFVGMGSGGPEQPVGDGGLSEDQIASIRDRFRRRKEGDSTRELRARMLSAPNADQAAIDADLAERQGVNRLEVERNRDTFVAVDRAQAIDDLRKTAPKLRAWLDYNPANLEVAHDDVENLGWWEQTAAFFSPGNLSIDKVGQALQSGFVDKIPEQLYGLDQMLGDANASIYKALPDWFPGKFGLVNEQVQRSLMADMKRQEMAAQGKANAPVGETWLERGIYGAAQSAPSTLVSLAITAVTKSPVVGSGSMGATTAGGAYGEARDEGKSLGDAFRYALTQGGIETATEFIPLKFLVDDLAKDSSFAKTFFRQAAAQGITEQAATFLQDASTFIELNPDKTLGEFLVERPNAALETLVASTIMSGVTTTVAKGVQAAGDQLDQNAKQKRAELLGKTFDAMAQNAKDSKLLKRLPEKYRELVNQVTKDGPLENVRIAPEAIVSLAQEEGVTVEQIAQAFRIDPNEMVTAMDAGEDVVIPAGNYAAGIAGAKKAIGVSGEEMHAAFAPNMRLRADDFTANEMTAMKSVMEAEEKARTEGGDAEQSFADAADRVRNTIREAVTATGLFNADAANTQAELVGSIVTTLAERTGQDPEALWKEQGFDIVASLKGEQPAADSLPQSVGEDATPTQRLIDMRAKGMGNAEIAAELYPDVDAKTATNRVKALASKHKAKIEERRAVLEGAKSLAQTTEVAAQPDVEAAPQKFDLTYTRNGPQGELVEGMTRIAEGSESVVYRRGNEVVKVSEPYNDKSDATYQARANVTLAISRLLGDGSVKLLGYYESANGTRNPIFSQQYVEGRGATAEETRAHMQARGFTVREEGKNGGSDTFVREIDGATVVARDLDADNVRVTADGKTVVIDAGLSVEGGNATAMISRLAESGSSNILAQEQRGTFTPREDRNVIRLFESANLSTLAHEGSHWYLDTLWRMSKTENPHPFVLEQLAAVLEWHGKSPNWDAMFNPDGSFTKEGVDLQEAFAESFEAYLMEGKAPTTALRSVFASFKQWLLSIYKGIAARIGGRARLNDEIRSVFDRMLATDEAIKAVHTGLARDGEAMAKAILDKQDPDGKWKPERREKFMERMRERYAAARERAEAALMARLMDEFQRTKQAAWRDEERQVKREVQAEVDARPEQRAFAWLAGAGWRETAEDRLANEAADEADAMRALAQAEELGYFEANATDASIQALQAKMVENGIIPIVLLFRTSTGRVIAFPGDSGNFGMHHDMAREVFGLGDLKMQHGVWNPRKWPTIEAMNAADTAWYDTTGTAADTIEAAPAQPRVMRGEAALAQGGEGLLVYRGTGDTELGAGRLGTGLYLAEDPEIGAEWGGEAGTVDAYRITGKLFDLTEETAQGLENYARRENTPAAEALFARLKAEGYVGVRDPWSGHINVFDAKDMVRTPQSDTELGKTWTNYALDLEQDGAGSLAQTVQPSRQLEDGPAAFGLTPEQAKKVNPIYNPKTLPVERLPSNQDAALWLEGNYIGDPVTDLTAELSDEQIKEIATIMAAEAQLALGNTGNAFTWYSSALAKALDIISIKYPMLADDAAAAEAGFGTSRNARFAFTYIMAVTSQNLDVAANSVATDKAFADMLKRVRNGDFTMPRSWGTGDKQKAMGENFAKFGPLIDKMPGDDFPSKLAALDDLFRVKMTVKEWVAYMKQEGVPYNKPGQTAMDAVVYGSSLLGPKIGNGFWQNLNGNYDPMTIDLWMRRTWGRLTGKSIGNPAALPEQRARLAGAVKRSRSREQGKPDHIAAMAAKIAATEKELDGLKQADFASKKEFTAEEKRLKAEIKDNQEALADLANLKAPETWSAEYNTSNDALLAYAKRLLKAWNVEYERLKEASNSGTVPAEAQPTWARAAKTIITNLAKPLDQVANGTQRKQIERAGKEALQILKARGIALTTADLQAILWYPEKELWGSLTAELETDEDGDPVVPPSSLNESYDTAFSRILKEQGYEVQGTSGDGSSGPGAGAVARQDAGPQGAQGAGGSGASGGAAAGRRSDAAGPQSLAQSQTHDPKGERELDALGFYSAVFEAAKSVRPDVWSMGWDHARNSIVKGGAKINGQRVAPREREMAFLGLDAMFYGTKLKGAELAEAVLDHIQAKRLLLVENFARFDPNVKAPTKAEILDEIDDDTLGFMMGVAELPTDVAYEEGRIVASELDGADEFHTGLFVRANKQEVSDDPVKRYDMPRRTYNLYRGLNLPGKRELIATGVIGDLLGKAARIILNENRNLVMRKISAANMRDYWEQSRTTEGAGLTRGPGDIRLPGEDVPLFEAVIGLPEGVPGSDYQAPGSHIGGKAKGTLVTAHGEERIDDKGQRTVFVGQVQSDMAQQAREDKDDAPHHLAVIKLLSENPEAQWFGIDAQGEYRPQMESDSQRDLISRGTLERGVADFSRVADVPLLSTSEWTNVAVRSMLYRAAREGFQSISFPTAETSEIIQGNDSAAMHYETNVKGALEKLAKQLGGEVRLGAVKYDQDEGGQDDPNLAILSLADGSEASREELVLNIHLDYGINVGTASRMVSDALNGYVSWWTTSDRPQKTIEAAQYLDGLEDTGQFVQDLDFGRADAYILDITPEMRAKIMSEGFPLFQTGDDKGRAAPPPNLPPMRLNLQAVKEQYGEQALAEIPPDVAAYSAEANDVEAYVQIARDVRKTLNETPPKSLWKFLSTARNIGQGEGRISYRGIRDTDGELLKIIGEKKAARGLIADPTKDSKRSRSYDMQQAIEAAWEAGYFDGEDLPTPAQFLDTLRADIDGQAPRYRRDDIPTVSTIAGAERWKDWFDQNDMDITSDVATLRAKLATVLTGQGTSAIGPDEAAEVFNGVIGTNAFPTGFDLLKALKQGPLRDKLIRDLTEQRMIERNGDVFRDGTIMQEAEAYARNEVQHRQFEIELEALAEAAGKGTAGALAKQTAIENLRSKQVREVLNYTQWLTLERRWAEKAIKAAAKGDTAQAAEFARYRLINSYMYSEGKKLAEKIEKTRKHLLDYGKKAKQVRLFAAGKEYQETMNGLLSDYQFRNETKKGESQRAARAIWIRAQMASIDPYAAYQDTTKSDAERQAEAAEALEKSLTLAALAEGGDAKGYKSLTVDELMAVRDEADMIWRMATMADQLLKQGERRRLSLAAGDVAAEIETNQPNEKPPEPIETDSPGEGFKRGVMKYFAMHRTLQSLARQFAGGKDGGKFWAYIVKPLNEAFANLSTLRKQMGEDMKGLFSAYTEDEQKRMFRDRRTYDFRQAGGPRITLSKQGRLAFALNWGNDKNRRRLMDSLGLDEGMVGQVLDTLDKRDWDFVQKTWDYLDTWFPEANRVHEAVHGAPMSKEAPLEVATRFGIYRGGYYPIVFDPKLSSRTGQRQMEADAKSFTGQVGARNEPGFAKKRTSGKVTLPLRLSVLDVIASHLDKVATSIATEEALFDAGRIVKQPAVEAAIVNRHGREIYNVIVSTLVTAKFGLEGASGILAHLRNGATVVGLGWKVSTALLQPLGISNSIVRVGGFWIAKGYAAMGSDAVTIGRRASWATEKSEFMRNRRQANSPEMAALRGQLKAGVVDLPIPGLGLGKKAIDAVKNNAFAMMANVQFYSVDVPTWYGALFKARAAGMSEADAVASADQAVIDAQGGGELHQTAAMQTGAGTRYAAALRLLTNFMSYMVTTYNIATQRSRNARTPAQIAALAMDFVILLAIPVAGKMALDAWTKGGGDDDDEEDPLWEKYMREQAAFIFSPFVGISQIAGTARGEDAFGYRGPAGLGIFAEATNAGKAAAELDFDESFWRPANRTAGMIFHYPAGQLDASIRGANAYFNGETDNPAAFLVGPPPAN